MPRSLYLHLASAQECATATTALNRLSELLKMVAALPVGGGVVLVSNARERAEVSDLILQYRGTAVLDATKVAVCPDAKAETEAAGGRLTTKVFFAPGYEPKSSAAFYAGALEFNFERGWWQPKSGVAPRVTKRSLPMAWMAWADAPAATPEPKPEPVYASVKLSPWPAGWEERVEVPAKAPTPGPWHRVDDVPTRTLAIQIVSETHERGPMPFRLRGELPEGCGGALNCAYPTQEAADAALPEFARRVREIWNNHTPRAALKKAA